MNPEGRRKGMINIWTAFALYAVLVAWAVRTLHGVALAVTLLIVGGLAAKSYVDFLRRRLE